MNLTYRVVYWIPNLFCPEHAIPVSVVSGIKDSVVLVGVNVSSCWRQNTQPDLRRDLQPHTLDIVWRTITNLIESSAPKDGYELIELLENKSPTNMWFGFNSCVSADVSNLLAVTEGLFHSECETVIGPQMPRAFICPIAYRGEKIEEFRLK